VLHAQERDGRRDLLNATESTNGYMAISVAMISGTLLAGSVIEASGRR
jgi:hypothetical protein